MCSRRVDTRRRDSAGRLIGGHNGCHCRFAEGGLGGHNTLPKGHGCTAQAAGAGIDCPTTMAREQPAPDREAAYEQGGQAALDMRHGRKENNVINMDKVMRMVRAQTPEEQQAIYAATIALMQGRQYSMPARLRSKFEKALRRCGEYAPQAGSESSQDKGLRLSRKLVG